MPSVCRRVYHCYVILRRLRHDAATTLSGYVTTVIRARQRAASLARCYDDDDESTLIAMLLMKT